ncbi:MAG: hypothetical protein K6U03_08900 [Firmicutes bacterium]|nr:hypothetical protein [Bacillota bacterium]
MVRTSVVGYPRIGRNRELKKLVEDYLGGRISRTELKTGSRALREAHWSIQRAKGIDWIPSNDFSYYDHVLDVAMVLNVIPARYRALGDPLDVYFAMARGHQDGRHDLKALELKKWFNTNYHYIVPEIDAESEFRLNAAKILEEYEEAKTLGIKTKPVLIGAYTFLRLARIKALGKNWEDHLTPIAEVYGQLLQRLAFHGVELVQLDEPGLVLDLNKEEKAGFIALYRKILAQKNGVRILLQTYFGDVRDIYQDLMTLDFDIIGLDFI